MLPHARFKAGDLVKTKSGEILKVLKSWQVNELFGILAGTFKEYQYLVENDKGRSFKMKEKMLFPCSIATSNTEDIVVPSILNPSTTTKKTEVDEDSEFDSEEDWSLSQICADWEGYERHEKDQRHNKPLPCLGKRKCFQLSPVPPTATLSLSYKNVSETAPFAAVSTSTPAKVSKVIPSSKLPRDEKPQNDIMEKEKTLGASKVTLSTKGSTNSSTPSSTFSFKSLTSTPKSNFNKKSLELSKGTPSTKLSTNSSTPSSKLSTNSSTPSFKVLTNSSTPSSKLSTNSLTPSSKALTNSSTPSFKVSTNSSTPSFKVSTNSSTPSSKFSTNSSTPSSKVSTNSSTPSSKVWTNSSTPSSKVSTNSSTPSSKVLTNSSTPSFKVLTNSSTRSSKVSTNSSTPSPRISFIPVSKSSTSTPKSSPPAEFTISSPKIFPTSPQIDTAPCDTAVEPIREILSESSPPEVSSKPSMDFLSSEEIKMKTSTNRIDPKDTKRKTDSLTKNFINYIKVRGVAQDLTEIPAKSLSHMLSSFWADRRRGDGLLHDTTTLSSEFSRLSAHISRETGHNPTTHPDFGEFRETKANKLKQSKQQLGNGQLKNQSDALDPEEISHFYTIGLINYGSGPGIVRCFFTNFMLVLNFRGIKDHMILKWGNIRIVRDSRGLIEYAHYVSQFTKSDDGVKRAMPRRGVIVPSSTRNTCFFTYYDVYYRMRANMGKEFLEPDSPFYLQPRQDGVDYVETKNHNMFLPKPITESFLENLLQNMTIAAEIEADGRKLSNTSLRISSFHGKENLTVDSETGQAISGHSSKETCATYRRKNQQMLHNLGAGLMSTFTDAPAVVPLTHGQKFKRKVNRQITIVDTSKTLIDITPQLLSLQKANEPAMFEPGDLYPGTAPLKPVIHKLPSSTLQPQENDTADLSSLQVEAISSATDVTSADTGEILAEMTVHEVNGIPSQFVSLSGDFNLDDLNISSSEFNFKSPSIRKTSSEEIQDLKEGSLVFCKVKGHRDPHWPGRISNVTESSFEVEFFGTTQTASMDHNAVQEGLLVPVSPDTLEKYTNPRALKPHKKKSFGEGLNILFQKSGNISVPSLLTLIPQKKDGNTSNKKQSKSRLSRGKKSMNGKENIDPFLDDLDDFVV